MRTTWTISWESCTCATCSGRCWTRNAERPRPAAWRGRPCSPRDRHSCGTAWARMAPLYLLIRPGDRPKVCMVMSISHSTVCEAVHQFTFGIGGRGGRPASGRCGARCHAVRPSLVQIFDLRRRSLRLRCVVLRDDATDVVGVPDSCELVLVRLGQLGTELGKAGLVLHRHPVGVHLGQRAKLDLLIDHFRQRRQGSLDALVDELVDVG